MVPAATAQQTPIGPSNTESKPAKHKLTLVYPDGAPIPDLHLVFQHLNDCKEYSTTTDGNGEVIQTAIPNGRYEVSVPELRWRNESPVTVPPHKSIKLVPSVPVIGEVIEIPGKRKPVCQDVPYGPQPADRPLPNHLSGAQDEGPQAPTQPERQAGISAVMGEVVTANRNPVRRLYHKLRNTFT
jgi:hypothetical protein